MVAESAIPGPANRPVGLENAILVPAKRHLLIERVASVQQNNPKKEEEVQKQPLSNNIQKIINIYIPTHIDVGEDVRMMGLISFIIHF